MLNEAIIAINSAANATWTYTSNDLFNRGTDMVLAPMHASDMLWMLLPLAATLLLMEFYFGRYKDEEMGWNTAFGNSLVLIFIAIDLFRHLFEPSGLSIIQFIMMTSDIKIIIPLGIILMALVLMIVDFFHFLPKKLAYIVSSPTYVNLISLLGIIIVYTSGIPLDWTTMLACIILFITANLVSLGLYYIIPKYKPTISKILTVEDVEKFSEELSKKRNKKN
jgi:hypothetical protein